MFLVNEGPLTDIFLVLRETSLVLGLIYPSGAIPFEQSLGLIQPSDLLIVTWDFDLS